MGFLRERSVSLSRGTDRGAFVGAFGKLPRLGEFVRFNMVGEPMRSFETWLEHAVDWGGSHKGESWAGAYAAGTIHAFIYRAPFPIATPNVLAGVIGPSKDAVGRRFPFVVFAPMEQALMARRSNLAALALGDFLEGATGMLLDANQLTSAAAIESRIQQLSSPTPETFNQCEKEYQAWTRETTLAAVWTALYNDPQSSQPLLALHTIFEALAPFRGRERPSTPLSVRLPLGVGGAAATAFWVDVVRTIGGWTSNAPTIFWSSDGVTGSVLIQLGDAPASSLAELWCPDPNSDYVCDLTTPSSVDHKRFLGRLPPRVAEVLEAPHTLVIDFLSTLRGAV